MPRPRSPKGKMEKTDKENSEYQRGEIRKLKKRVRMLERENARLSKYLRNTIDWLPDEEDAPIPSLRPPKWECKACGHTKFSELILPFSSGRVIKHRKCLECDEREKIVTMPEEGVDV